MGVPHRRRQNQNHNNSNGNNGAITVRNSQADRETPRRNRHNRAPTTTLEGINNNFRNKIYFSVFLIGLFSVIISVYFININIDYYEIESEENMESASRILRTIIDVCNALLLFEDQMIEFLEGERLANLIKDQLQPVQDRVTSLTTQTSQYEKMNHIPGGPTHFIGTALQELDTLEENQLSTLDEKVQDIINEEMSLALAMGESGSKLYEKASYVLDVMRNPNLFEEGILIFTPEEFDDGQAIDELAIPTDYNLEILLVIMSDLAEMLEKKEEYRTKTNEIKKKFHLTETLDEALGVSNFEELNAKFPGLKEAVDELEWISVAVDSYVEEYEKPLRLILSLHTKAMNKVAKLQEELLHYAANKRRAYLDLRATLREDIRKLKVRIQNLRYKYAKINPV